MISQFEDGYRQRFSFLMRDKPIVVEAVSVELVAGGAAPAAAPAVGPPAAAGGPAGVPPVRMFVSGSWADVPLLRRAAMAVGQVAEGPAIIAEDFATTVVEPGWQATVTGQGDLLLTRTGAGAAGRGRLRTRSGRRARAAARAPGCTPHWRAAP